MLLLKYRQTDTRTLLMISNLLISHFQQNHVDFLIWAHENGCPLTPSAMQCAASYGHLEAMQYLLGIGAPWDRRAISSAASTGSLEILQLLFGTHKKQFPAYEEMLRHAAQHPRVLRWLKRRQEKGEFPVTTTTCTV